MTTYYIATQTGNASNGYLVANGESFAARSGGFDRGDVPAGTYTLGGPDALPKKHKRGMSPGGKDWRKYKKFYISGVGPKFQGGELPDSRGSGKNRIGVRFHYDGNGPGTAGCIGYDTIDAQTALTKAYEARDREIQVIHVADDAAARAKVKELTGQEAPTNTGGMARDTAGSEHAAPAAAPAKGRRRRRRRAGRRTADVSDIKNGARMASGERTVVLGEKMLVAAHMQARHTGGGRVVDGSRSVYVGRKRLPFGRVEDPTTDGSQLSTGEDSVLVG